MGEPPTYTVAKHFDEEEALREIIDALRADNGRLLRLLLTGVLNDGRPEHKELTEILVQFPNLRRWLGTSELSISAANQREVAQSSSGQTAMKARHRRGRRAKRKKK